MLFFRVLTTLFHPRRAFGLSFLLCLLLTVVSPVLAAEYDLVLNHSDSPDPAIAGGVVTYTLRVTNDGDVNSISNIQLTDTLPSGVTFLDTIPTQGSCTAPSGGQFTCDLGTLAPQAEATVTLRVRTTVAGTITNSASVTSTTPGFTDPDTSNNSQVELTTVNAGANLALTKIASPTPSVQSGATLIYTLTVTNAGPDAATNVRVTDNLPTGFVRTGSLPGGCTQVGQVVTCDISGSIAMGGNRVIGPINGTVTAASPSTLTNAASATITNSLAPQDPDMSDNTVTVNTTVTAGYDLAITKTQSVANPIIQGNSFNYVLTVASTGDNPSNISVTDTIPVNFTIGIPSGTGWSCTVVGQLVTCTRAAGIGSGVQTLPAITIPVTATTTGNGIVNTGTVTSTTPGFTDPVPGNNSSSVTTNVLAPNADLRGNKTALRADGTALSPALVEQGVQFRYRISVTNLGPSPVTSGSTLIMTDTLPAGITADSYFATNGWSCTALPLSGPATITCTRTFPTGLAVNATSPVVDIYVTATTTGALTNQVCASGGVPADTNAANDCASATVTSQINPTDLQVYKTDSPDPVNAGEILTYAIEIVNVSTVTATTVTLTDTFTSLINNSAGPTGSGFIDAVVTNNLATGGSCSSATSGGTGRLMTCTFTGIPQCTQGTNCPIVTARVRPRGQGNRTNSAYAVSSDVVDTNIADNTSATDTTVVNPIADVRTTITDTPDPLQVGTNLTYVGTIINQGPSDAANGTIDVTLPIGVAFLSASPSAGSCATTPGASGTITTAGNQTVGCNLGTIALLGGQRTVTIIVRPTLAVAGSFPATITAQSSVDTPTPESDETNNTASTTTQVTNPGHDLLINKTDSPDPVAVGDNVTYTINATNNGPSYATAVQVVDTLPTTRLSFVSATPSTGSCSAPVGNVVTCDVGDIPVGQSRTVSVVMTGIQKGVDNNSVSVSSAETRAGYPDILPANNSVTEDTTVRSKVDLELVSKVPALSTVELRQPFNWTISIRNNTGAGLAEADNVVLSDSLPSGMELTGTPLVTVTSGTFSTTTCTGSAGQTSFSCTLGTVSNGATGTITVPVRVTTYPAAAPHTMTNCASLTTISIDINPANNTNQCGTVTVQKSSLAGYVYRDLNDNGAMNGGETGITGVTLTLTGTDAYGNAVNRTTTTNGSGAYLFDNLSPSDGTGYTVTETQPAAYFDGLDSRDNGATAIPGSKTTDVISAISVPANTALTGYLFGELPATSIGGYVWHDQNNDTIRDGSETTGISNVQITLTGTDDLGNPVNRSTTSNASGAYIFDSLNLRPGTYTLTETAPPSPWLPGKAATGTGAAVPGSAGNTPGPSYGNIISAITLTPNNTAIEYNFGELLPASLAGLVFNDNNGNGSLDVGEPGIVNVTVTLTGTDDLSTAINIPGTTAADGSFSFTNLRPGTYAITETQPPVYVDGVETAGTLGGNISVNDIISNIVVASGNAGTGYLFAERSAGIAGTVYVDLDNDGLRDAGEAGIAGVTVTLTGTDSGGNPVSRNTTTSANGDYLIVALPASNATGYTITETQPAAWADGLDSAGTAGGTVGNDIITNIILNATTVATGYNFGERGGSIAGTVYNDINNNGIHEPAEPGIPNATVTLTGTDINGNALTRVTTTAADGSYHFTDLPMPNATGYTITETQPAGWNDGQDALGTLGGTLGNDVFSGIHFPIPGASGTGYNFGEIQGTAGIAQVSGKVWLDTNHDRLDNDGNGQAGWTVELIQRTNPLDNTNYLLIATTITNAAGDYAITGVSPGTYEIRFRYPSSGYVYGIPISTEPGVDLTYGTIRNLTLNVGDNILHQNLPLDPGGVVYDAVTRLPVAGATVTISGPPAFDPAVHLVGGAANASQTTDATGKYQFLLYNSGPNIAPPGTYTLAITTYPTGYLPMISAMIPPCGNTLTVGSSPNPALVQNNDGPPTTNAPGVCPATSAGLAAGANTTQYFLSFAFTPGTSANVVNNHIPLDPAGEALLITKTVNKKTASVGDLILYTLRIQNTTAANLNNVSIRDNIPAGFKYVESSARLDGQAITPVGNRPIEFQGITFTAHQTRTITYVLVVGSGVQEGQYENTAFALMMGNRISNIARASVCIVKDPIFDLTTIIGKVFHDKNGNGVQDEGEEGIALAKVVSVRGEIITTDQFGRYHIAAVDAGRSDRGRNYILKVDPKSLPAGATFTTDNPRVIRITPGLMQKMNFGVKFPDDSLKSGEAVESVKKGDGGRAAPPAGTTTTPAPGGNATPPPEGAATAVSGGNVTPLSEGKGAPEGKTPSISVTQDRLLATPKLNLSIANDIILRTDKGLKDDIVFFIYTNYPDFIEKYEIIIYEKADLEGKYPLKTIALKKANNYEPIYWDGILDNGSLLEQNKEYKYILEAYGKKGRRDVTLPKFFTVTSGPLIPDKKKGEEKAEATKGFPGFGIDNTAQRSIIPEGEKVVIYGKDLSPTDKVYIDDQPVAVDEDGRFIAESFKSPGEHQSTIVVKDAQGAVKRSQVERIAVAGEKKGSLKAFFKDFFQDFFIVGIIDLTLGQYSFRGHVEPVAQDDHYDEKVYVDGRAAFYLKGKIKGKYLLTAYLDTEEGKLQDIYKRLGDKDPKRIFRNLDPDKYYPVYGDDSTLVSDVETQGRFYVKLEWDKSKALWGNYNTQITGTELARYNRSLYGGKVYYESVSQTKFGDSKGILTGFISEAQTFQDHNEFLSTGGSLYYLKHQHVVEGSDKVSIQIRDKNSGRVINTATLIAGQDYTIDYYQGRILLNSPLPIIANSNTIISSALLNGDAVSLVADYEYNSECFGCNNGVENLTGGARGFWWIFDQLGVGSTFVREAREGNDYNLYGVDAKIKFFKGTYTNIEFASSQQTQIPGAFSVDGGLSFSPIKTSAERNRGNAYKIGQVIDFKEITKGAFPLNLEAYYVFREQGFSSLDKDTEHDTTEYGVNLHYDITKNGTFRLKYSTFDEKDALLDSTGTAQLEWRWTDRLRTILEVRYKKLKEGEGYVQPVHPEDDHVLSNEEDVIAGVKVAYDLNKGTQIYAAQQVTVYRNDETPRNNKTTLGISSQIMSWLKADLEGFVGDLGYGGRVGLTTTVNERLNTYTNYMLSTDRTEGRTQRVTFGSTYRMNDKTDIYSENQFKDSRVETANSEIVGIKYRPTQSWNIDFKYENSHVTKDMVDSYVEQNIIKRDVASLGVTYDHGPLKASSRFELRLDRGDEDENQYVTTNSIKYILNKEWTFLGNLNFSLTRNRTNHIDDARFFEINTGFAYRPIKLDKLNMLFKYTYLEDLPPLSQQGSTDVDERSHVVSLEGIYDLSRYFSLAGKAAFKSGQMRLGRTSGEWVSSDTMLFAGRLNYQFIKNWDASLEYRFLKVVQAKDYKHGPVVCLYRHIGDHVMIGVGYNFTDFNDDLTNLNYEAGGWFVNFIATW